LSGGSAPNSSQILVQVQELLDIEGKVREANGKLQGLMRDEAKTKSLRDTWRTHIRDLEIKQHELKLLEEQIGGSNASLVSNRSPVLFLF
jgi:structural maintenance of chromosome 2